MKEGSGRDVDGKFMLNVSFITTCVLGFRVFIWSSQMAGVTITTAGDGDTRSPPTSVAARLSC